ncbi:hypothetical protein ABPG75_009710 [Micractinium tetrahymenae]
MANSDAADLMSIGAHCAHPGCHQLDFLPFKCGGCGKTYCLDHRVCGCTAASNQVVVCPLCARAVVISPGEDVELVFDRHTRTECDPSNYDRVHRKARCPAGSCREKLTSTNSYTCRDCGQLIEHAETAHASGWSSGAISMQQPSPGGGLERCPHCGRQFADPVELVAHVERQHAAADSSSNCVLC